MQVLQLALKLGAMKLGRVAIDGTKMRAAAEQTDQEEDKRYGRGKRAAARPKPRAQYNFTNPASRIMKGSDGFVQAYNAQAAVEPVLQLIVG